MHLKKKKGHLQLLVLVSLFFFLITLNNSGTNRAYWNWSQGQNNVRGKTSLWKFILIMYKQKQKDWLNPLPQDNI